MELYGHSAYAVGLQALLLRLCTITGLAGFGAESSMSTRTVLKAVTNLRRLILQPRLKTKKPWS